MLGTTGKGNLLVDYQVYCPGTEDCQEAAVRCLQDAGKWLGNGGGASVLRKYRWGCLTECETQQQRQEMPWRVSLATCTLFILALIWHTGTQVQMGNCTRILRVWLRAIVGRWHGCRKSSGPSQAPTWCLCWSSGMVSAASLSTHRNPATG